MCRCNPLSRTPFCGRPGCEWPEQLKKDLGQATKEAQQANEELENSMAVDPEMFDRVNQMMKDRGADIQTPIRTADGKLMVLYSQQEFDKDEIEVLSSLTKAEIVGLLKIKNFKTYPV